MFKNERKTGRSDSLNECAVFTIVFTTHSSHYGGAYFCAYSTYEGCRVASVNCCCVNRPEGCLLLPGQYQTVGRCERCDWSFSHDFIASSTEKVSFFLYVTCKVLLLQMRAFESELPECITDVSSALC